MRLRIAKIDEQSVAQILRDVPVKTLDDRSTGHLIRLDHLPQVFWIQLPREYGRVRQVTEQHGELAALSVGCLTSDYWWTVRRDLVYRGVCLFVSLGDESRRTGLLRRDLTAPDQHTTVL